MTSPMRSPRTSRRPPPAAQALLPALALALVAAVLGFQLAHGGGDYEPLRPADACAPRSVTSQAGGIDGLTEKLVLLGVNDAACRLHVSRETLILQLAGSGDHSDAQIDALREGLHDAVEQLSSAGQLPPASDLVDEAIDATDLNGFLKAAIKALPDSVVNGALKTDDVLNRTIDGLDLRTLLGSLDDSSDLNAQLQSAVTDAVKDALAARLRDLL